MLEALLLPASLLCVDRALALARAASDQKRMETAMPLTLSEIEADKDQLRGMYAVKLRRLEASLTKAKEKSAHQLVEMSRLQMSMTELADQVASLERALGERRNAAGVFELTIKKRLPELEGSLSTAQATLNKKVYEIADLQNKVRRREEALIEAQRLAGMQEAEVARLREAMDKSGAESAGRFKKRPAQWELEEYRSEYDRLNGELSKLREQLAAAYDREAHQISFLKTELQQLGEQIMTSVAAPSAGSAPAHPWETARADDSLVSRPAPRPAIIRRAVSKRVTSPEPWPKVAAQVEAEPLEKGQIVKPFDPQRPSPFSSARLDDFANKSLEEVLEAALPMSAERVSMTAPVISQQLHEPQSVAAQAAEKDEHPAKLNTPVLTSAAEDTAVADNAPVAAPEAAVAVVSEPAAGAAPLPAVHAAYRSYEASETAEAPQTVATLAGTAPAEPETAGKGEDATAYGRPAYIATSAFSSNGQKPWW
jgi:predicted  nucleic acid-binding Zn-ribbon protein